ncbi:MAG: hypothetical protein QXI11_02040 [Thermoproteota archaeon]
MIEKRGNTLLVGAHEWAWSRRTLGFPVYAVLKVPGGFELQKIGETLKHFTKYYLPKNTVAVVRKYVSNLGNRRYYIYVFDNDDFRTYILSEVENFSYHVEGPDKEILNFVREWILKEEVEKI